MTPSLGSITFQSDAGNLVHSVDYPPVYDKGTEDIRMTNQLLDEETRRGRFGSKELRSSWSLGSGTEPGGNVLSPQPGSSPNPVLLEFYGGFDM